METIPQDWLQAGRDAADKAGTALLGYSADMRRTSYSEEQGRERKIAADAAVHAIIHERLSVTGLPVRSEEGDTAPPPDGEWGWIVDPLDGSANFQRGLSLCAVSIALCQGICPKAGFIFDLHTRELVCAGSVPGMPAPAALQCSTTTRIDHAMICTGIPARLQLNPQAQEDFFAIFGAFFKIRMLGAAVQSLLHLATGKTDAYYESNIMFWDVMAGQALAEAAGCRTCCQPGTRTGSLRLLVTAPGIFEESCQLLHMTP